MARSVALIGRTGRASRLHGRLLHCVLHFVSRSSSSSCSDARRCSCMLHVGSCSTSSRLASS
eukprot:15436526-Alexandrium_andersonii.AAC.1